MTPEELRQTREKLGLTQAELSEKLLISDGRTVRRWEAGDRAIPGPAIAALRYMLKEAKEKARKR